MSQKKHKNWLVKFISIASRKVSMLDNIYIKKLGFIIEKGGFENEYEDIIIEHCERILKDLKEKRGERLGRAIIKAQDMFSFVKHGGEFVTNDIRSIVDNLDTYSCGATLNRRAKNILVDYNKKFNLKDEDKMEIIGNPMTEKELDEMYRKYIESRKIFHAKWKCQDEHYFVCFKIDYKKYSLKLYQEQDYVVLEADNDEFFDRARLKNFPFLYEETVGKYVLCHPLRSLYINYWKKYPVTLTLNNGDLIEISL